MHVFACVYVYVRVRVSVCVCVCARARARVRRMMQKSVVLAREDERRMRALRGAIPELTYATLLLFMCFAWYFVCVCVCVCMGGWVCGYVGVWVSVLSMLIYVGFYPAFHSCCSAL